MFTHLSHTLSHFRSVPSKWAQHPVGVCSSVSTRFQKNRERLFYWILGNRRLQRSKCIHLWMLKTKRKYTKAPSSRRKYSREYFVKNGAISEQVCKSAFISIHGISNGRLERAISAQIKTGGSPHAD